LAFGVGKQSKAKQTNASLMSGLLQEYKKTDQGQGSGFTFNLSVVQNENF
jgi:hypothetical protein